MNKTLRTIILVICIGTASLTMVNAAFSATYYIDYVGGYDSNNGTATSTPWKRCPGMVGFTGTYTHAAGDHFIFKGGVTWPNAVFPLTITKSGSAGNYDYYGVDQTWYTGGSWSRPIFDGGGAAVSGAFNQMIHLDWSSSVRYVTIDNIDFKGFYWTGSTTGGYTSYSRVAYIGVTTADYINLTNLYLHNWRHGTYAAGTRDDFRGVQGDTNSPYCNHCVIDSMTCQNSDGDSDGGYCMAGFGGNVTNSLFHDVPNAILVNGSGHISGNEVYNITADFDPGVHINVLENTGSTGTYYIHNNKLHDFGKGSLNFIGGFGQTYYFYNNLIYNVSSPSTALALEMASGGSIYILNNTIVPYAGAYCVVAGHGGTITSLVMQNNHCITTNAASFDPSLSATTLTKTNNLLQTPTVATTQGYVASKTYAPTVATNSTVGTGTNSPSSLFTTDFLDFPRPLGSAWDIGAYQFRPLTLSIGSVN